MTRLHAVGKRYRRGRAVLTGVDLELPPGTITSLVGGNGSGKSTLLRIVVGLSPPSEGSVTGRPAVVGYVPERFPPDDRLGASAYLAHMGRIRGLTTRDASARANELLERLSLTGGASVPVRRLSKGNAQKVALAQALLVPPELLVLDEPWPGLDVSAHEVLAAVLRGAVEAGAAVLYTDHHAVSGVEPSAAFELDGGRLGRLPVGEPGSPSSTEVVLTAPSKGGRDSDWCAFPGVHEVLVDDPEVTVRVVDERRDALLLQALRNGWSVVDVRRPVAAHDGADHTGYDR